MVAGTQAEAGGVDAQGVAGGVLGQRVGGVAGSVEGDHVGHQILTQVAGGDELHAVVAVLASAGHEQIDERCVADLTGAVAEVHREREAVAQQHVAAATAQADSGRGIGQQSVEVGEGCSTQGDALVDVADPGFQVPVPTSGAVARVVVRGRHIRPGPARKLANQDLAGLARADAAAVELDVGPGAQMFSPLLQVLAELANVFGADCAVSQGELSGCTMREHLDRVHLTQLCQRCGNRRQPVFAAVDHNRSDIARKLIQQLFLVFQASIQHQQAACARRCTIVDHASFNLR